jgi:signal transduction histidine kinase
MPGLLARGGLRWRLAAWVVFVLLVCTGISFLAVYHGTGAKLRAQVDKELGGDAAELGRSLQLARPQTAQQVVSASDRYVGSQPFAATSTLLFTLTPGARTSTNRPELFGQAPSDNGESVAQQAGEDRLSRSLVTAGAGYSTVTLPDLGDLRLLKRPLRLPDRRVVTVGVGEPLATVAHAQAGVARAFILAGILALAGALAGAYLIGNRLTRPLRRMATVAARVDAGDLHPRIHDPGGQGTEIEVLAEAFNNMLDRLTEAFAAQRAFVADASHELRTPLTVIAGQLEVLARQTNPPAEEVHRVERVVQAEIARIGRLVDDLLLLAKSEQREFLRVETIELPGYVSELWDGMEPVASRRFELGPLPSGTLRADPDRLTQALRNLLTNAIEHTADELGLVRMRVEPGGQGLLRFLVEDDGPGIDADQRERVFDRFQRTDTARDRASGGAGLGLAIARAIADAHGGRVWAEASAEGGARIVLELGGFTAQPPKRDVPAEARVKAAG